MKKRIHLILYVLSLGMALQAINIDSLKTVATKSNLSKDWNAMAGYYFEMGDSAQLKYAAEKAYQLAMAENNDEEMGYACNAMAELERFRGSIDGYEHYLRMAWENFVKAENYREQAIAMINIGYCYTENQVYDSAIAIYHQVISFMQAHQPDSAVLAGTYFNLGSAYLYIGMQDSTVYYIEKTVELAKATNDIPVLIGANNVLGMLMQQENNFKKALEYFMESLRLHEESGQSEQIPFVYGNIASTYFEWGKLKQALEFSEKGLDYARKSPHIRNYGIMLMKYGADLILNKKYQAGIDSIKAGRSIVNDQSFFPVVSFLTLAIAYTELDALDSAAFYLKKMDEIIEYQPNSILVLYYFSKGSLAFKQNDYRNAISYLEKYDELVKDFNTSTARKHPEAYNMLSEAYAKEFHDMNKALKYKNIAYDLQDSIYQQEQIETMNEFYARYQTAEKELEISRLNEQKQQMLFHRWLIVGGFVILTILLLAAWMYNWVLRLRREKSAAVLAQHMEEKEKEHQIFINESERRQMQSYLDGLESERQRIASELHDNLANEVLHLRMEMENAPQSSEKVSEKLQHLHGMVRDLSHELIFPVFQFSSLPSIVANYVETLNNATNIDINLEMIPQDALTFVPEKTAGEMYRILQESLGNSIKHAHAQHINVSILADEYGLKMSIEDDGVGFDPAENHSGIGLQIMQRRCDNLHGEMNIASKIGKGTTIVLKLPYYE